MWSFCAKCGIADIKAHEWSKCRRCLISVSYTHLSAQKRDAIQYFKTIAENGEIDILLLYIFDRLGRIESETPFVLEWFVKHGVQVWSTREGEQRIENHTDKLLNYIRFWQAAGESEKIAERVSTRIRQLNSSGYYSGGTVPYGYRAVHKGRTNKKGLPVKDLEIEPAEATIVQELFGKTAYEGQSSYALADLLNQRGLRTHSGAKFTSNHILRIIRHEGYTGYIITRSVRSQHIPELQIVDAELFKEANKMVSLRCNANAEARKIAQKAENNTLLAGIVYCAHCGARMSGFMHMDRYKLKNGKVVEALKPKYNCFQRAQPVSYTHLFTSLNPTSANTFNNIKVDNVRVAVQNWLNSQMIYPPENSDEEYSFFAEKAYPIDDDRRKYFQHLVENKNPSLGYHLVAMLAEIGWIKSIWTTNFDGPVSYTHLDVYKRQHLAHAAAQSSATLKCPVELFF